MKTVTKLIFAIFVVCCSCDKPAQPNKQVFMGYQSDSLFIKLPVLSQGEGDDAYFIDDDLNNDILITRQIVMEDSLFGPLSKIPILQDYLNEHFTNPDIVPELKLVIKIKIKNSKNYYEDMFIRQEPIWADRDTITHQFLYPNYHEAEIILKQTLLLVQDKKREGIEITYHPFSDYGNSKFTMLNFTRMEEK